MPNNLGATLFNSETGAYEFINAADLPLALGSGKYISTGDAATSAGGSTVSRPVSELGAALTQGEESADATMAARAAAERHEAQLEANSDKIASFAEAVVDAGTLGLIKGRSPLDNLRREADSGTVLLGQLAGTALTLGAGGPGKMIAEGGEAAGRSLARSLIGRAESATGQAFTRAAEEAVSNAAVMAVTAWNNQVMDAVIADKPLSAETVLSEAGLGAALGFGAGWLGSTFGKLAKGSREAVEASGVALKETETALEAVKGMTGALDDALETHAKRLGVLEVLASEGKVPAGFMGPRSAALKEAEKAAAALKSLDADKALSGDAKAYSAWRDAVEKYDSAVRSLDESMKPKMVEMASRSPVRPGEIQPISARPPVNTLVDMADRGVYSPVSKRLDELMTPEKRAQYEAIYGRPYEDFKVPGSDEAVRAENLSGRVTPTSENKTGAGRIRPNDLGRADTELDIARARTEVASALERPADTMVDPRIERFNRQLGKVKEPRDTVIDVEGRTVRPPKELEPARPMSPEENGTRFAEMDARQSITINERGKSAEVMPERTAVETGPSRAKPERNVQEARPRTEVDKYLDDWFAESKASSRLGPADRVESKLKEVLDRLAATGTKLDSAGALEVGAELGLKPGSSSLGQRLDQVWSLRQVGKMAADEARGVKTPLRKGLLNALKNYGLRRGARAVAGSVAGGAVAGPVGALLGYALTSAGFAGAVASSTGRMVQRVAQVGEALLKGPRSKVAVRAAAGNRPYQYDEQGELKDPIERIRTVQRLSTDPDRLRATVRNQMGDITITSPELSSAIEEAAINKVRAIAVAAPALYMTPLGKVINPTGTAMKNFLEFENAMQDLPGLLKALESGTATTNQIRALHIGFPAVHAKLVGQVMKNADKLATMSEDQLKTLERTLGIPLTKSGADPAYTMRMQRYWKAPEVTPPGRPQALKITAPQPTAAQSAHTGKAPGNMTKEQR